MDTFFTFITKAIEGIGQIISMFPFSSATWFVLAILGFIVFLLVKANNNPRSHVNWEDLVVRSETNKLCPYKLGYLIGVVVSTWVVVKYADQVLPSGESRLTWDILGGYLIYLLGGAGWSSTLMKRGKSAGATEESEETEEKDNK